VRVTDDEAQTAPAVTLVLTPDTISENGGGSATETARLSGPSGADTAVKVPATSVPPSAAGDFSPVGTTPVIPAERIRIGQVDR